MTDAQCPMRKCTRCLYEGPEESFPITQKLHRSATCQKCTDYRVEMNRKARTVTNLEENKENISLEQGLTSENGPLRVKWRHLAVHLSKCVIEESFGIDLLVTDMGTDTIEIGSSVERRKRLASEVLACTGYRFNIHSASKPNKNGDVTTQYYCAQREGKQTKQKKSVKDEMKQRDRSCQDRFRCGGSMRITSNERNHGFLRLQLTHSIPHIPYCNITPSDGVKKAVKKLSDEHTPNEIYKILLKDNPDMEYSMKQIHYLWSSNNQDQWKLDTDPLVSAKKCLENAENEVTIIPLEEECGMYALAFALNEPLSTVGKDASEIALDGTFNTNSSNCELSALVAEYNGQGIPIGFILTSNVNGTAQAGAKSRILANFLRYFKPHLPNLEFTISDKEMAEIEAFNQVWPEAKHQVCIWHALRTIEGRLAEDRPTAPYDPHLAHARFPFIDRHWKPISFKSGEDSLLELEGGGIRPRVVNEGEIEFELEAKAMREVNVRPKIIKLVHGTQQIAVFAVHSTPLASRPTHDEFCPNQFRRIIVEKFRRHACQHPYIPFDDEANTLLTATEIYEGAVKDMYTYLFENNLPQVWAYLWNCWYEPRKWMLWSRSSHHIIPRIRTSMIVEGFWRGFKHGSLAAFSKPRLDFLIYLILTSTLNLINDKLAWMNLNLRSRKRIGRPKPLAPWQKDFKREWEDHSRPDPVRNAERELALLKSVAKTRRGRSERHQRIEWAREQAERTAGTYSTLLDNWTCTCPSYLTSRFLSCKHLIRAANTHLKTTRHGLDFFKYLRRHHLPPFYHIPGIHPNPDTRPSLALLNSSLNDVKYGTITFNSEMDANEDLSDTDDEDSEAEDGEYRNLKLGNSNGSAFVPTVQPTSVDGAEDPIHSHSNYSCAAFVHPSSDDLGLGNDSYSSVDGNGKVYFTDAYVQDIEESTKYALSKILNRPNGVHPKFKRRVEEVFQPVLELVHELDKRECERKRRRTWKDSTANTLFA